MQSRYELVYSKFEAMMLQDADDAISKCELWEWLRTFDPNAGEGFMLTNHPNLNKIIASMKYEGHSGSSFAWTMRTLQTVARIGWTEFVKRAEADNPPCPCRRKAGCSAGWCGVAGGGVPACDH
jgi:hypothetical protein